MKNATIAVSPILTFSESHFLTPDRYWDHGLKLSRYHVPSRMLAIIHPGNPVK